MKLKSDDKLSHRREEEKQVKLGFTRACRSIEKLGKKLLNLGKIGVLIC